MQHKNIRFRMHELLLENLTTAILVFDNKLRVQYMNPAAEIVLATSDRQVHGLHIEELFSEEPPSREALDIVLQNSASYSKREAKLELPSGHTLTADYTVTPFGTDESLLLMELQPRDRLLRISKEETLKSKQETAKTLVRGLAHEIKNPLGGIRGAAQLLSRELPDPSLKEYTCVIIEEADRLRNLVDRMLGPINPPRLTDINIHEVLERVCSLISAETAGQLQFKRDYDPSIPEIEGDQEQLIQALLNIVRNAMQAVSSHMSLSDASITLKTRPLRQFTIGNTRHRLVLRVDITDNGPGIPKDIIDNVFYPMISGRAEGTGLGLSIAQSIIGQHSGLIACESQPGETVFSLYLPFHCSSTANIKQGPRS